MVKEIGGYIEWEHNRGSLYHDNAVGLNCGRACLEYIIRVYDIKRIWLPLFLCDSVKKRCSDLGVETLFYNIDRTLSFDLPTGIKNNDWIYTVNYYGQMGKDYVMSIKSRFDNIIVDNAQAYYELPVPHVPTIYTCRKFFGVPDGAFLYTDRIIDLKLETDISCDRMEYLFGRFEKGAAFFYDEYRSNEEHFDSESLKKMSILTENILRGINYDFIKKTRTNNWLVLHKHLCKYNRLELKMTENAFAYPFYIENGMNMRNELRKRKIYVPLLWPNVLKDCPKGSPEYEMAENILPLPCDQRYSTDDMRYLIEQVMGLMD